jgi:hypothetical protein
MSSAHVCTIEMTRVAYFFSSEDVSKKQTRRGGKNAHQNLNPAEEHLQLCGRY